MKFSLRTQYFIWLMGFTFLCMLLNFSMDMLHDAIIGEHSSAEGASSLHGESGEFLFILLANLAAAPFIAGIGWLIARRIARPILDIAATAARLHASGPPAETPKPKAGEELSDIADALQEAFRRYDALLFSARRFNSNAAHQLRAPLAAMRAMGEVCLNRPRSTDDYREALTSMLDRTEQMSCMVDRLLSLSELSMGDRRGDFEVVDLTQVVAEACDIFLSLAEEKGLTLAKSDGPPLYVRGSFVLLLEMMSNLVDNALQFTPAGGRVELQTTMLDAQHAQVTVTDTGIGIAAAYRERVFQRFDQGPHPNLAGTGLGLPIVAEIVAAHGGTVEIPDVIDKGTRVSITLPAAVPARSDTTRA